MYNVRDRGLVIISSCGHSGIVNTIKHVQAVTGIDKIHAVVGGIHLAAAPDAQVAKTADAFQQIQPDYFVPMHCTGFYPALAIEHAMPRRVVNRRQVYASSLARELTRRSRPALFGIGYGESLIEADCNIARPCRPGAMSLSVARLFRPPVAPRRFKLSRAEYLQVVGPLTQREVADEAADGWTLL